MGGDPKRIIETLFNHDEEDFVTVTEQFKREPNEVVSHNEYKSLLRRYLTVKWYVKNFTASTTIYYTWHKSRCVRWLKILVQVFPTEFNN